VSVSVLKCLSRRLILQRYPQATCLFVFHHWNCSTESVGKGQYRYARFFAYPNPSKADSKTMPLPQSPHGSSPADLSGGFGAIHPSKDTFCAPVPLHPQVPLPSVALSLPLVASTMTTSFHEHNTSKDFMILSDHTSLQWAANGDLPVNQMGQDSNGYQSSLQYPAETTSVYGFGQNGLPCDQNYNLAYSAPLGASCPRSHAHELDLTGQPMGMPHSYPPAAYQIEPQRPYSAMGLSDQGINGDLMQLSEDYDCYNTIIKHEHHTDYSTPYDSDFTRSCTPSSDPPMPPPDNKTQCRGEDGAVDKEQPYAQLIFHALKGAPNNTMILRDIYDWFKRNTDKASDNEKKGWQNSIRHNLSMNGVLIFFFNFSHVANRPRRLRKLTSRVKIPRKASCGDLPRRPFVKMASSRRHDIAASSQPNVEPDRCTRNHNAKRQAPKAAKLHDGRRGCDETIAITRHTLATLTTFPDRCPWATRPSLRKPKCRTLHTLPTTAPAPAPILSWTILAVQWGNPTWTFSTTDRTPTRRSPNKTPHAATRLTLTCR
jgi:hypothetical protein